MKNVLIALGLTLAASTAALADSSVLDVVDTPAAVANGQIDYTATASIGSDYANPVSQPRFGDGSPVYQ